MAQIKFADLGSMQQLVKEILDRFPLKGHTHTKSEITDYVVDNSIDENSENPVQNKVVHAALEERVPIGRTVNGKSLNADISLTATDIGADVSGAAAEALTNANIYTDTEIANLVGAAPELLDTFEEVATAIQENKDVSDALQSAIGNKADKEHNHTVTDITDYVAPIQSDWNQDDETALDYVKNRPFHGVLEDTIILEETTLEPNEDGYIEVYLPLIPLEENKAYTVTVDGEIYECVSIYDPDYDEYVIATDLFWVVSCPSQDETYIGYNGDGTHTISISTMTGEVTKLDRMYLPDSVFAKSDWDEYNPSADGFIKNKPFSRVLNYDYVLNDFSFEGDRYSSTYTSSVHNRFIEGQSYHVLFDGELYEDVVYEGGWLGSYETQYGEFVDYPFGVYGDYFTDRDYVSDYFDIYTLTEGNHSISIYGPVYEYYQLDDQYLPASITSDWNETNVNKRSFIKNKPFSSVHIDKVLFEGEITPEDINVDSEINIDITNAVEYDLHLTNISAEMTKLLMSDQLSYTVVLNGVEYRNLVPKVFYHPDWAETFVGGIGAPMSYDGNQSVMIEFTEDCPFSIKFNDLDGMYYICLPREFEGNTSDLRISVFGTVVDKIDDIYQHQADWNELVDTKASFIANKPFGEYLDYKLVPIIERAELRTDEVSWRPDGYSYGQQIEYDASQITNGNHYTVIINGNRYDNVLCFDDNGDPSLGVPKHMLGCESAEYPFFIDAGNYYSIDLVINTEKLPITEDSKFYLYEYKAETKVKTLDIKYLPEHLHFGKVKELQYTTILDEEFTLSNGGYGFQPGGAILEEGKSYKITLDGNVFEGTALADVPGIAVWVGENAVIIYNSEYSQIAFSGNPGVYPDGVQHHIVIETPEEVEVLKTIDKKYLPEYLQLGKIQNKTYADMQFDINSEVIDFGEGVGFTYSRINTFEEGCSYKITLNGKEYELVAFIDDSYGDEYVVVTDNKTFTIEGSTRSYSTHFTFNPDVYPAGTQVHTIIQKVNIEETYKTLKTKYLPEHLRFGNVEADADIISEQQLVAYNAFTFYPNSNNKHSFATIEPSDFVGTLNGFDVNNTNKFYKVVFDGVEYYCSPFLDATSYDEPSIGSPSADVEAGTGEYPFRIYFMQTNNIQITASGAENIHTFALSECEGTITQQNEFKTIDLKYLPEHLQFGEIKGYIDALDVNITATSGGQRHDGLNSIEIGDLCRVDINGNVYEGVCTDNNGRPFITDNNTFNITLRDSTPNYSISLNPEAYPVGTAVHVVLQKFSQEGVVKTLDTKYLPELGDIHTHSWNDLEDKPFGETESVIDVTSEVELLPNGEYGYFVPVDNYYTYSIMGYLTEANMGTFESDKFYKVVWDGVEYYCPVFEEDKNALGAGDFKPTIGSSWADIKAETATYPFSIYYVSKSSIQIYTNSPEQLHTMTIYVCEGTCIPGGITKIDSKYLPEHSHTVSESDLDSTLAEKVNAASEGNHSHANKAVLDGITADKVSAWDAAEGNAKAYADGIKNDLLNGAGEAYDTLKELGDLIDEKQDAIAALETVATGKADKEHKHSWNDLEDRPFYETEPVETDLFEETTLEVSDNNGLYLGMFPELFEIEENKEYTVTFNGETYNSVGWYFPPFDSYCIGNSELIGLPAFGNNEPFIICTIPADNITQIATIEAGPITLKISRIESTIVKLNEKYLPDSALAQSDWDQNDYSSPDFIKNKPFGKYLYGNYALNEVVFEGTEYYGNYSDIAKAEMVEGQSYDVYFDGEHYEGVTFDGECLGDDNHPFKIYADIFWDDISIEADEEGTHEITVYGPCYYYEALDGRYIPASIASDWNEKDPYKVTYINNKPFSYNNIDAVLFDGEISIDEFREDTYDKRLQINNSKQVQEVLSECLGLHNQIFFDVEFNGVEYKNLSCFVDQLRYKTASYYIGAPMALDFRYQYYGIVYFSEEMPFNIDLTGDPFDEVGQYMCLRIPKDFSQDKFNLKIKVHGIVVKKIEDIYQHQSDWNQLTDDKASYIQNKPFGEYLDYTLRPIIERGILNNGDSHPISQHPEVLNTKFKVPDGVGVPLYKGLSYSVIINGVRYDDLKCFITESDYDESIHNPTIGSPIHEVWNVESEYPFAIEYDNSEYLTLWVNTKRIEDPLNSEFYLYEYVSETKIKTIDTKYLPEQFQFGELTRKNTIIPETNFSGYEHSLNVNIESLVEGEAYTVVFDDIVYPDMICAPINGEPPTPSLGWINDETMYLPFTIMIQDYTAYVQSRFGGEHSLSVTSYSTVMEKIDPKYLPFEFGSLGEVIYPETAHTSEYYEPTHSFRLNDQIAIYRENLGETYIVTYDGIEYECVCYEINGYKHLGNPLLLDNPGGNASQIPDNIARNGEPFVIICDVYNVVCEEGGTHTIGIVKPVEGGSIISLAQKAIEDSEGNVISETYALKSDLESIDLSEAVDEAKAYTDEVIGNITNGTTTVANAANAEKLGDQPASYYAAASAIPTGALANKNTVSESDLDSALAEKVNAASEGNHSHANKAVLDGITADKVSAWDAAEGNAKAYADGIKNDLLNGAGEAYDTLKELGDLIDDNKDALGALETVAANKADKEHTHSWNDLEDRPFYETEPVETVILEEVFEQLTNDGTPAQIFREGYPFVIGQTYTVILDGTTYECVAWDNGSGIGMIGNANMIGAGNDTSEPFVGIYMDGLYNIMCSTSGSHNISISGMVSELKRLDEKFISYKPGMKTADGGEIFNDYANNVASYGSHAEGSMTTASGDEAHAEGYMTTASGLNSHAEGNETTASEWAAHAEGFHTTASGSVSHAEGRWTTASGDSSHAEGNQTIASGDYSHAEGCCTTASSDYQHVQGRYNVDDSTGTYLHIVGNGENINEVIHYSNAHTLDWDGNAWYQGTVEATALILSSSNGTRFQITVGDDGVLTATEITIE